MRLAFRFKFKGIRIRLSRAGCTNRPFYHIVAIDRHRGPKSLEIHEQLGSFDVMPNQHGERLCAVNFEGVRKWMAKGATLSRPVAKLLGLSGFLPIHWMTYMTARRVRLDPNYKRDWLEAEWEENEEEEKEEVELQTEKEAS